MSIIDESWRHFISDSTILQIFNHKSDLFIDFQTAMAKYKLRIWMDTVAP